LLAFFLVKLGIDKLYDVVLFSGTETGNGRRPPRPTNEEKAPPVHSANGVQVAGSSAAPLPRVSLKLLGARETSVPLLRLPQVLFTRHRLCRDH